MGNLVVRMSVLRYTLLSSVPGIAKDLPNVCGLRARKIRGSNSSYGGEYVLHISNSTIGRTNVENIVLFVRSISKIVNTTDGTTILSA